MHASIHKLRRLSYGLAAIATVVAVATPAFQGSASAAQVTTRSVQMSDSTVSATGVQYLFTFTPAAATAKSIVIDFCQNSSIIGGTCTTTNGVNAAGATFTAGTGTTGWTLGTAATSTVKINGATAIPATPATFTLNNITNPTVNGTFFVRIYTYSDQTYGSTGTVYTSPTAIGSNVDYGGFALSTANNVTISATVMETLTFCVSKAAPGASCSGTTTPALVLGHGSPTTLDSTATDLDTAYTQISSNALTGVDVRLKVTSSTTCAGLSRNNGVSCDIVAKNPIGTITPGTAFFGLNVAGGTGGTGTVAANAAYSTASQYNMSTATYGTYGDAIENSTGATSNVNSLLTYAASAATTTPAGVFTATHSLIATGKF